MADKKNHGKQVAAAALAAALAAPVAAADEPKPVEMSRKDLSSVAACHYDKRYRVGDEVVFADKKDQKVAGLSALLHHPSVNTPDQGRNYSDLLKNGHPVTVGGKRVEVEFATGKDGRGCSFTLEGDKKPFQQMQYLQTKPTTPAAKVSAASLDLNMG